MRRISGRIRRREGAGNDVAGAIIAGIQNIGEGNICYFTIVHCDGCSNVGKALRIVEDLIDVIANQIVPRLGINKLNTGNSPVAIAVRRPEISAGFQWFARSGHQRIGLARPQLLSDARDRVEISKVNTGSETFIALGKYILAGEVAAIQFAEKKQRAALAKFRRQFKGIDIIFGYGKGV